MSNSSDDENTELSYCFSNLDRLQKRSSLPFSGRSSVHPVQDLGFRMRDSDNIPHYNIPSLLVTDKEHVP